MAAKFKTEQPLPQISSTQYRTLETRVEMLELGLQWRLPSGMDVDNSMPPPMKLPVGVDESWLADLRL